MLFEISKFTIMKLWENICLSLGSKSNNGGDALHLVECEGLVFIAWQIMENSSFWQFLYKL